VLATSNAQAQEVLTQGRSVIHGRILEQGRTRAIQGATVTLLPANIQFTTDANGRFLFEGVAAGTHTLRSELEGHTTRQDSVIIEQGTSVDVLLRMTNRDRKVDAIEVTVRSSGLERVGFYDRRDEGRGTFLGPRDIRNRNARVTTDLFRDLPLVEVGPGSTSSRRIVFRRGVSCTPDIYIDNQRLGQGLDVDQLRPEELLAIEVYMAGSIPQYYTSSTCGVILFWTRRRNG
jgi:hypothetical protein